MWRKLIRLHMNTLVSCDFFTKSVITQLGVQMAYCLMFIHVGTRKVLMSPSTFNPNERWVEQQSRNLFMGLDDQKLKARFVLHGRDTKFSGAFGRLLMDSGITRVRTPALAPDANSFAESWIGSFKRECLNHFLCFGLRHLDHVGQEYVQFHNTRACLRHRRSLIVSSYGGRVVRRVSSTAPPMVK